MTACSRWFSTSSRRISRCALDEPKSTPSGTMTAARPPTFSIRRKSARKSSSVFLVLQSLSRSAETMSASRLPLKGGLARIRLYFSRSVFWSLRLSRYSMNGLSTPCVIMFMAPIRSIVRSMSKPWNMWFM